MHRLIILLALLCCLGASAQVYDLKSKKYDANKKYGYENVGDKYWWWAEAHALGAGKDEVNQGYETQWFIAPQYDKVSKRFSEGLAAVEVGGQVGFIDKYNRFIIEPQFEPMDDMEGFRFGLAVVKKNGKYGFIDKRGNFVINPGFDGAENFGDDYLAVVKMGNKFGCIDLIGDTVVPCEHLAKEVMKNMPGKNKKYREEKKRAKARWDDGYYDEYMESIFDSSDYVDKIIADPTVKVNSTKHTLAQGTDIGGGFRLVGTAENGVDVVDAYGRHLIPWGARNIRYQPSADLFIVESTNVADGHPRMGLASVAGGWIIPPVFESISDFDKSGLATATIGAHSTKLDAHGLVEEEFLQNLLNESTNEKGSYYTNRLLGVLPSCAPAHNNLGIYYVSELDDLKHGIKHFSVAHDIDPDNENYTANMKAAKGERNSRRWNRVLTGLQITAAVLTVGAATYSAVKGNSLAASDFSASSTGDFATSSSTARSSGGASSKHSSASDNKNSMGSGTKIKALSRSYDRYESMVVECNTYPEKHRAGDKAEYQAKMRSIRLQLQELGYNRSQSPHETN